MLDVVTDRGSDFRSDSRDFCIPYRKAVAAIDAGGQYPVLQVNFAVRTDNLSGGIHQHRRIEQLAVPVLIDSKDDPHPEFLGELGKALRGGPWNGLGNSQNFGSLGDQ